MSQSMSIKSIVIVGGGSAGWMTAATLSKVLDLSKYSVTLIESKDIQGVSVGEATIPQITLFNRILGIGEADFIRATNATYKLGIEFKDWKHQGHAYFHPFGTFGINMEALPFHHFWLKRFNEGAGGDLCAYSVEAMAAKGGRFGKVKAQNNSPLANMSYAYHFDSTLYANFLRDFAVTRGVRHVSGKVETVSKHLNGHINTLTLQDGQCIDGEFYIDCSGFRSLLLEKEMGATFSDWSDLLPCDSAIAIPCKSADSMLKPYTQSTAKAAGWTWRIPLQHRIGNGYVYSSKFTEKDVVLDELMAQLEGEPLAEPNFLAWKTGMRPQSWIKNCLGIGLSAGFIEPLESTGLHLIQSGIARLMTLFPNNRFCQSDIDMYNRQTEKEFEQIRDFIVLHYALTERNDSEFWRYCRNISLSESLNQKMQLYKDSGRIFRIDNELFNETSWLAVMHGQGLRSEGYHPLVDRMSTSLIDERLTHIASVIDKSAAVLPEHAQFIAQLSSK
ncbi:Tryptophan halogenase [Alteromonas sp. 38]|uniref:tryptophan halogenase family protein n=1 Tax=unclassified Alteromonas TaxID=2614992 RepID=UPI0012F3BCD7|nr:MULTISPECIES: tryptophan halogenase family protein [unclassified Alteromonas]CAD5287948.1 Tryptophan halogenase [Alteromonas sp. 154]VXB27736.1 Tryptophan halogenase [Alteromonas sp. 38]